ncbi:MAG: helix-turn-helix domain-containing protein, partial [Bacillota bacterium]|nr:helix-turn-helix domain-containing protein [Bacillota bacterium]
LNICIGMGSYYEGLENLRCSYSEALQALKIGKKLVNNSSFYFIDDMGLSCLIPEINTNSANRFQTKKLSKLLNDNNFVVLRETFIGFCDCNMSIAQTANTLFLHRNTLLYRLNKIAKLTGLDPRNFQDAIQLYTAFHIKIFLE